MSNPVEIKVSKELTEIVVRLGSDRGVLTTVARTMDLQNEVTIKTIQERHLSGPTGLDSLSVRTGLLRRSIRRASAVIINDGVESSLGTNVVYAGIHEFGGVIHHKARQGSVRLREDSQGNLLRQGADGRLAVFAKKSHKRARTVQFEGKAYNVTYPERAPIRKGILGRSEDYGKALGDAVVGYYQGKGGAS